MILGIVSLSVCGLFSVFYTFMRLKANHKWGIALSFASMMLYVIAAALALFNVNNNFNNAYIFILIGLIFGLVGDVLNEFKDDRLELNPFLNLGMISYAIQRVLLFTALVFLVFDSFRLEVFLISIAVAVGLTLLIWFIAKMIKLEFRHVLVPMLIYFLITTFFLSIAIWYAFYVPTLIMFSLSFLMFFFSDLCLLKTNLGNIVGKQSAFIIHNIFYAIANLLIIAFLFFSLF